MKPLNVLSLQSGTSADGIDVAIVRIGPHNSAGVLSMSPLFAETYPLASSLQKSIIDFSTGAAFDAGQVCRLHAELGKTFAYAATRAVSESRHQVGVAVSHGQTVYHWVDSGQVHGSLQLGEAAWIAEALQTCVISNVRAADIAAGGQGAPLMALFDQLWLKSRADREQTAIATINIGGISNLQIVSPSGDIDGESADKVSSFDTGPGNTLIDEFTCELTGQPYDDGGQLAAQGTVHALLLEQLLAHPYFAAPTPKSTGRETFTAQYVRSCLTRVFGEPHAGFDAGLDTGSDAISPADLLATLTELTATSIATHVPEGVSELIVSGGGALNTHLMGRLAKLLVARSIAVTPSEAYSVDPLFKESYMFALLGYLSWHRIPIKLGNHSARVAGQISFSGNADLPPRHTHPVNGLEFQG